MPAQDAAHTQKIRELNDEFRRTFRGGDVTVTPGIYHRSDVPAIVRLIQTYDTFEPGNDPYGEHDFGAIRIGDQQLFWKIDYLDLDKSGGSPDPSDPNVTYRLMTIMLAEEY